MSFLKLPREIRDQIYELSLFTSQPIIVWDGTFYINAYVYWDWVARRNRPRISALQELTLGLLRVNRLVASEAACTFYRLNTFRFEGTSPWDALCIFSNLVGKNKRWLRHLHLQMKQPPEKVLPHLHGTFISEEKWALQQLYDYDEELHQFCEPHKYGFVEYICPALRLFFKVIGKDVPLTVVVALESGYLPGFPNHLIEHDPDRLFWGMTIPTSMEYFREKFAGNMEILWKGDCMTMHFLRRLDEIKSRGWEVIKVEQSQYEGDFARTDFIIRRRPISPGAAWRPTFPT
jgi:hypothetical protein